MSKNPAFPNIDLDINLEYTESFGTPIGRLDRIRDFQLDAVWTTETKGVGTLTPSLVSLEFANPANVLDLEELDDATFEIVAPLITPNTGVPSLAGSTQDVRDKIGEIIGTRLGNVLSDKSFKKILKEVNDRIANVNNDILILKRIKSILIPQIPVDTGKLKRSIENTSKVVRSRLSNGSWIFSLVIDIPDDRPIQFIRKRGAKLTVLELIKAVTLFVVNDLVNQIIAGFSIKVTFIAPFQSDIQFETA